MTLIDNTTPVEYNITTLIDNTTPVENNITTLIDKTTPVEYYMLFSYQTGYIM